LVNILNNVKDTFLEIDSKESKIIISTFIQDEYAVIDIMDNAKGIPEDKLDKIFDPYFSTKEEGQGIGVGLYMTKIIIESNMNGKLRVRNTDDGVIFTIKLPLCSNEV
jgi:C4-dicarboxylate-specific signal transduction histidine kinase